MKSLFVFVKKNFPLFLVLLFQIPLILPFFHKGFFPSHDDVQVVRVFEMYQSLRYGDVPPRWSANLLFGHGYPLYVFYAPLPFLIGALLAFLKLNFLLSTKAVFILSFFMGGVGVYFLVKQWWGKLAGLVSAIAFSYAPYRAVDVYVRGNLGEFFSFSLFPWVFWLNWKVLTGVSTRKKWLLFFTLFLLFQEVSHNVSCFIFFLFLLFFNIFYLLFLEKKNRGEKILNLAKSFCLSLLMAAYYLIPLLWESKFVNVGKFRYSPYQDYFLTIKKAWDSTWSWGGYIDPVGAMSLRLGKSLIVFSALAIVLNMLFKNKFRKLINFLSLSFLFFFFLEIKASGFIWKSVSLLHFLQFPWRFHVLTTLTMALLCGGLVHLIKNRWCKKKKECILPVVATVLLLFFCIKENIGLFKPQFYWDAPAAAETTTWNDEYLPKWVKIKPKDFAGQKIKFLEGKGEIINEEWGYLTKKFVVNGRSAELTIEIAHIYYPGWEVYVSKKKGEINYNNDYGLMRVTVPEGENKIEFVFKRTSWRLASELVSIVGVTIFLYWCFSELRKSLISKNKIRDEKDYYGV